MTESITTGTVEFLVDGKKFETWFKVFGDLKSKRRPIVALHGGPGLSHDYMLPCQELYIKAGIPVLFYDQIGNGNSSHYRDAPKEFWTPELFMDELDNILQKLGIYDDFDLLGHSWGGMLGGQYAATRSPKGLKRLILSHSPSSVRLSDQGADRLMQKAFGSEIADVIYKHESAGTIDNPEYQKLSTKWWQTHMCTVVPWPDTLIASFVSAEKDPTVSRAMCGPNTFSTTGSMKDWSIVDILHKITSPTLVISSPRDYVQPITIEPLFIHIPRVKWVELQNSTHIPLYEDPEKYFGVVLDFLAQEIAEE